MRPLVAGEKIGEWTVIQNVNPSTKGSYNTRKKVRVECSCGKRETIPVYYLTRKHPPPKTNCGHLRKSLFTLHPDMYTIWMMMHTRCYDPKHVAYKHYGGRGIGVCDEWHKRRGHEGFKAFIEYMGPRPTPQHSIDRIDNDLGYQPFQSDGVTRQMRWATAKEQRANQRVKR